VVVEKSPGLLSREDGSYARVRTSDLSERQVEDPLEPFEDEVVAGADEPLPPLLLSLAPDDPDPDPEDGAVDAGVDEESDPDPDPDPEDSDDPVSDFAAGAADSPATEVELPERLSVL
jgi:hypothetical protein